MGEKLHKALAGRGLGSRREMERWIVAGRVTVNGAPATVGERVEPSDEIAVDGRKLRPPKPSARRVLVANKRAGVIVSRDDPGNRPSVFDDLPALRSGRWIAVGRLDYQTTGLLLLTNDGALANTLMHPRTGIDREYAVRVTGKLDDAALKRLAEGVQRNGRREAFSDIRYYDGHGANHWYHVVLTEGRNREVRALFASQGAIVTRLKRVRYGPVVLPPWLPRGAWEEMGERDLARLCRIVGIAPGARSKRAARARSMLIPYPRLPGREDAALETTSLQPLPNTRSRSAQRSSASSKPTESRKTPSPAYSR